MNIKVGDILEQEGFNDLEVIEFEDRYRLVTNNVFETKEQAEAYRSELIERNK